MQNNVSEHKIFPALLTDESQSWIQLLQPARVCLQVDEIYSVPDVGTVVGGTLYR